MKYLAGWRGVVYSVGVVGWRSRGGRGFNWRVTSLDYLCVPDFKQWLQKIFQIIIIIIIIIIIVIFWEFFALPFADVISMEFERQQVSSSVKDYYYY